MKRNVILILFFISSLLAGGCEPINTGTVLDSKKENRIYTLNGKGRSLDILGDNLFVCGPMDCQVVRIDLKTGRQDCIATPYIQDAHGLRVYNNYIWVADIKTHQIYKIDVKGNLIWSFGERCASGCDKTHLNRPTDIAVNNDGRIYIADGYGNSRIICIDSKGKYLFEWGSNGNGTGQFNHPHNLVIVDQKVFVADRDNNRIQVFSLAGDYIAEWKQSGKVFGLDAYKNRLYMSIVGDISNSIVVTELSGNKLAEFGETGKNLMQFKTPHGLSVDKDNVYVADMENQRIQIIKKIN